MSYFVCVFFFFIVIQILRFALDDNREKILHFSFFIFCKLTLQRYNIGTRLVKCFRIFFSTFFACEGEFLKHEGECMIMRRRFCFGVYGYDL